MKKISCLLLAACLVAAFVTSCKKENVTLDPEQNNPNQAKFTLDGKSFAIDEKNISTILYKDAGAAEKAMDLIIPVENGNLKLFVADFKAGNVSITKKTGTAAWANSDRTIVRSIYATSGVNAVSNNGQTYVKYNLSGNSFYGLSGTIEITYNESTGDYTYKWNISFKDGSGKDFTSVGTYSGNTKTATVKTKSEITDPTPVTPLPTVESISPAQGKAGDVISITGTNFSTVPAENIVSFNGVNAVVKTSTATKITVEAPTASTGPITVKVGANEAANKPVFTYQTAPPTGTAFNKVFEHNIWPSNMGTDSEQNFYVSGMYLPDASNGGNMNFQLFKINSNGDLVKRFTYSDFGYTNAEKFAPSIKGIDNNWNGDVYVAVAVNNVNIKVFKLKASSSAPELVYTITGTADQKMFEDMSVNNDGEIIVHDQTTAINYYKYSATGIKSDFILTSQRGKGKTSFDQQGNLFVFGDDTRSLPSIEDKIFKIAPDKSITTMPFTYTGSSDINTSCFKVDKEGKFLVSGSAVKFDINTSTMTAIGQPFPDRTAVPGKITISLDMKWVYGFYMNTNAKYVIYKLAL